MFDKQPQNRRAFLRHTGQLALSTTTLPFMLNLAAIGEAAAFNASGTDYKALVCIFLSGGNDYGNTLVPYDATRYAKYAGIRGELAVPKDTKLDATLLKPTVVPQYLSESLRVGGPLQYALHPSMVGMANLFNSGKMAIQLNVGPLIKPISRADFDATGANRPPQLFSHPDQQHQWNSPSATVENKGWGGGVGDAATDGGLNSGDSNQFTCISVAGNRVYLSGNDAVQYQLDENNGAIAISGSNAPYNSTTFKDALNTLIEKNTGTHKLELAYNAISKRSRSAVTSIQAALNDSVSEGIVNAAMPQISNLGGGDDRLRKQLKMVARLIKGRAKLGSNGGPRRQVFYVELDQFDLHDNLKDGVNSDNKLTGQVARLTALSTALTGFQDALNKVEPGLAEKVTSFTASDFGRTLVVNGGGSDHGWGNHHFVVGGAVNGQKFYGVPPPLSIDSRKVGGQYVAEDQWHVGEGRLLPTTSVDQYAGTLAKWFGVSDTELPGIFPNITKFGVTSNGINYSKDMGFMAG